ncbi:HAD-IA family hydrolase [uncultured Jatrophihabitans sp.]|uniref:HAD-IA family hydrolase n=1 Tax=uncultured Jatrophihabitans sp. TaxID=1610747 RepID=UPI0035CA2835
MTTIGLVGAGAMGSALGANWIAGGAEVRTCVSGRSTRTRALVAAAGVQAVDTLHEVVTCDLVVSVVPPGAALAAAGEIADAARAAGATPLVADLNAISPETLHAVAATLADAGLPVVDGSISGGPPTAGDHTRVYACGARADEVDGPWLDLVRLPGPIGRASALKMCTASMYKGSTALVLQAMVTARRHGVLAEFLDDTAREWPRDVPGWPHDVAVAATKADRFVAEMHEIAATQREAGLAPQLFDGVAAVYARATRTPLGGTAPEDLDRDATTEQILDKVTARSCVGPAAALFDFSGTLFHIESAQESLLRALGADYLHLAPAMERFGGINGSSTPQELPDELAGVWAERDLSARAHHDAYSGLSRYAGLDHDEAETLYRHGTSAEAWHPFPDTIAVLRRLHARGVPVAVISNIGWDPRPVLARYGVDQDLDALVLSYEVGVEKPDPEIFRLACAALQVDPADAVMVGDNPEADGASTVLGIPFVQVAAHPGVRRPDELTAAVAALLR